MTEHESLVARLWTALNHQDIKAAVALLHPDVDWQDIINGGRRRGLVEMAQYWEGAFGIITSASSTLDARPDDEGRLAARVLHSVRDKQGRLWTEETLTHLFSFRDGLISRMDVAPPG